MSAVKYISWNVNGVRASVKKGLFDIIKEMQPDVLCLQETKGHDEIVLKTLEPINDQFHISVCSAERKGYSGTAILSKIEPLSVRYGIEVEEHDNEGRVIAVEFEDHFVVNVYVPNAGQELARLDYRKTWDAAFLNYLKQLEQEKPIVVCGDFNVAHRDIDLARPKPNYNKSAGYTQTEIDGMDNFVNAGLIDSFRHLHPETVKYSWWSFRAGARARNIGWRIDYFLVSDTLKDRIKTAFIENEIMGSDHCPVGIEFK
ncbi:MAG: exodeoxyribonuclease III [Salibacteraceae bacterium]